MSTGQNPKPVFWIGSAKKDLRGFPEETQRVMGYALWQAQQGEKHLNAKPLRGFGGAGVLEAVNDNVGSTFRVVYAVKFAGAIYALHAFRKSPKKAAKHPSINWTLSESGSPPRKNTMRSGVKRGKKMKRLPKVEASSGNVFADLGLPNSEELVAKAELVQRITHIITERKLTQVRAAALLGLDQPKVSALLRGKFDGYSSDRLFRFLNALGQDVQIVICPHHQGAGLATTSVISA